MKQSIRKLGSVKYPVKNMIATVCESSFRLYIRLVVRITIKNIIFKTLQLKKMKQSNQKIDQRHEGTFHRKGYMQ